MSLYQNEIVVGAHNSETEPYRITRIERVIGYVCALAEQSENDTILSKIVRLEDHKGVLKVTWRGIASVGEKEILSKAWRSRIGDGADNVEHVTA